MAKRKKPLKEDESLKKKGKMGNYNYYAVSAGNTLGIFKSWLKCSESVTGYSKAKYKGYTTLQQAKNYLAACNIDGQCIDFKEDEEHIETKDDNVSTSPSLSSWSSMQETQQSIASMPGTMCNSCLETKNMLSTLLDKVKSLESIINKQSDKINTLEEAIQKERLPTIKSIREEIQSMTALNNSKLSYANVVNNKQPSTEKPTEIHTNKILSPPNISTKPTSKPSNQIPFKPEQSIVVILNEESPIKQNFDQDVIRKSVNQAYGPTIIEKVNKYKFSTPQPKIIVQFSDKKKAEDIVANWKPSLFGGSTARHTIHPSSNNDMVLMAKGVPLSISEETLNDEINTYYPGTTIYRLKKGGRPMRTVKLTCTTQTHYAEILKSGLMVRCENMLFHVERFQDG